MNNRETKGESYKSAAECSACGSDLPENGRKRYGRYKDFCSFECRNIGRSHCKGCGKELSQNKGSKRDFCDNGSLCRIRYYNVGTVETSYVDELNRTTCISCKKPITQNSRGGKRRYCSIRCRNRYNRISSFGIDDTQKWGQYAPETRKVLLELEHAHMPMTAKRLATAIDREYVFKQKPFSNRQSVQRKEIHMCKGCGKEFCCYVSRHRNTDYCSNICQVRKEQGIEGGQLRGEDHPAAKVTWEQVDEIRSISANKQITQLALGEKYRLSKTTIRNIIHEKTWKPENDPRRKQGSETA